MAELIIRCTAEGCPAVCELPAEGDRIPLEPLRDWNYTSEEGWTCPEHHEKVEVRYW